MLGDGKTYRSAWHDNLARCSKVYRTGDYASIWLEYQSKTFSVYIKEREAGEYSLCAKVPMELDYKGYLVVSAAGGYIDPDSHSVLSIVGYDPSRYASQQTKQALGLRREKQRELKEGRAQMTGETLTQHVDLVHMNSESVQQLPSDPRKMRGLVNMIVFGNSKGIVRFGKKADEFAGDVSMRMLSIPSRATA